MYLTLEGQTYAALQLIAYLYRRILENDAEDVIERIKTSVIMLEGMTRLKIPELLEVLLHICLFNTGWVIQIIMI